MTWIDDRLKRTQEERAAAERLGDRNLTACLRIRESALARHVQESVDFTPSLHPRDRRGQFRETFGDLHKSVASSGSGFKPAPAPAKSAAPANTIPASSPRKASDLKVGERLVRPSGVGIQHGRNKAPEGNGLDPSGVFASDKRVWQVQEPGSLDLWLTTETADMAERNADILEKMKGLAGAPQPGAWKGMNSKDVNSRLMVKLSQMEEGEVVHLGNGAVTVKKVSQEDIAISDNDTGDLVAPTNKVHDWIERHPAFRDWLFTIGAIFGVIGVALSAEQDPVPAAKQRLAEDGFTITAERARQRRLRELREE